MKLIKLATKLGYKHHTQYTIEELDDLSSTDVNKQIELFLLQRWIREVHNIDIYIEPVAAGYGFYIHKNGDYIHNRESYVVSRNTYEEALEVGLYSALKLLPDVN